MHNKKLAIIGRGTVGCTAAAFFLDTTDFDIDWYYDPNIKPTPVGEGTTLDIPRLWANTKLLPYADDMLELKATPKIGIHKRNWGSKGTEFLHPFPNGFTGFHFSGVTFQDLAFDRICNNPRIKPIASNASPEEVDSDFVFVCTGSPKELDSSYVNVDCIPVNAALVSQCMWDNARFDYSLTYAMPHGWVFGIPLRNRCSIGYVHNSDYIDRDQADKEVRELLHELNLEPSSQNYLNFKNYYRKNNFSDRVAYCGNASFFLEPLEATSLASSHLVMVTAGKVWNGDMSVDESNRWYTSYMRGVETMIAMHYAAGSTYDTKFWVDASKIGRDRLEEGCRLDEGFMNNLVKCHVHQPSNQLKVPMTGTWDGSHSFMLHAEKLGLGSFIEHLYDKYNLNEIRHEWDPTIWEVVA